MPERDVQEIKAKVFDIQRWSLHDGPGVRTIVFLKGCPLSCQWCSNPESQAFYNELVYFKDKCISCLRCVNNCPHDAIAFIDGKLAIDRKICSQHCYTQKLDIFPCTRECYSKALSPVANEMSVAEALREVMKDEGIYRESEVGGVTVSGGEPASQWQFVVELFRQAHGQGITTAMETSGYVPWDNLEAILEHTDYLFYDFKAYDEELHKENMKTGNSLIKENLVKASQYCRNKNIDMTIRIPVVPTLSQFDDFKEMLEFIDRNADGVSVELMPYHRLGRNKYTDLGMSYGLMDLPPCSDADIAPYRAAMDGFSFRVIQ